MTITAHYEKLKKNWYNVTIGAGSKILVMQGKLKHIEKSIRNFLKEFTPLDEQND